MKFEKLLVNDKLMVYLIMKIGVTSESEGLDSIIDTKFGRCRYLVIVDPETMEFESISNEGIPDSGGPCERIVQTFIKNKVDVVITSKVGPNAFKKLSEANMKVVTEASGTVNEAVEIYKSGELVETRNLVVDENIETSGISSGSYDADKSETRRDGQADIIAKRKKEKEGIRILNEQIDLLENEFKELENKLKKSKK